MLLKIDLTGSKEHTTENGNTSTSSHERVRTSASFFFQLRNLLIERKYLNKASEDGLPKAGEFVEFEGFLKRNPIVETIDSFAEMMSIAENFDEQIHCLPF